MKPIALVLLILAAFALLAATKVAPCHPLWTSLVAALGGGLLGFAYAEWRAGRW